MRSSGVVAPFVIDNPLNRVIFEAWVEQALVPELRPGDIVVMGKGYDTRGIVAALAERGIAPHIARDVHVTPLGKHRHSAVPEALTENAGYIVSQRIR